MSPSFACQKYELVPELRRPLFTSAIQSASIERRLSQNVNGWQNIITRLKSSSVSPLNNHVYFEGHAYGVPFYYKSPFPDIT